MKVGLVLCSIMVLLFVGYLVGSSGDDRYPDRVLETRLQASIESVDRSFEKFNKDFETVMESALEGSSELEVSELSPEVEDMLVRLCKEDYAKRLAGEASDKWFWADIVLLKSGYWTSNRSDEDFPEFGL